MHDMVSEQRVVGFALALVTRPNAMRLSRDEESEP